MPVVNVNLVLDDDTYKGVMDGALVLCGMVKDKNHRIRKHLPTVLDSAKDGAAKAIDFVRANKKGFFIIGGIAIVGGAAIGTISYFTQKEKRNAKKHLGKSFQAYIDAAKDGALTVEIVDALISDLDAVSKLYNDESIPLNLSTKQILDLLFSIYDYTKRMAEANSVTTTSIHAPKVFKKNTIIDLQNYLYIQKDILSSAA